MAKKHGRKLQEHGAESAHPSLQAQSRQSELKVLEAFKLPKPDSRGILPPVKLHHWNLPKWCNPWDLSIQTPENGKWFSFKRPQWVISYSLYSLMTPMNPKKRWILGSPWDFYGVLIVLLFEMNVDRVGKDELWIAWIQVSGQILSSNLFIVWFSAS